MNNIRNDHNSFFFNHTYNPQYDRIVEHFNRPENVMADVMQQFTLNSEHLVTFQVSVRLNFYAGRLLEARYQRPANVGG